MRYSDTFTKFSKTLAHSMYEPLPFKLEREYLLKISNENCEVAFNKVVQAHLRFIVYTLRDFQIPNSVDMMDVIQEATIGFIVGLRKFNPEKYQCRVMTYCVHWVRFYINKYLKAMNNIKQQITIYIDEVGCENDVFIEEVVDINQAVVDDIVKSMLSKLDDRERVIITHYYGLTYQQQAKTLEEIGSMLHLNFERVRQIRDIALKKINQLQEDLGELHDNI